MSVALLAALLADLPVEDMRKLDRFPPLVTANAQLIHWSHRLSYLEDRREWFPHDGPALIEQCRGPRDFWEILCALQRQDIEEKQFWLRLMKSRFPKHWRDGTWPQLQPPFVRP